MVHPRVLPVTYIVATIAIAHDYQIILVITVVATAIVRHSNTRCHHVYLLS